MTPITVINNSRGILAAIEAEERALTYGLKAGTVKKLQMQILELGRFLFAHRMQLSRERINMGEIKDPKEMFSVFKTLSVVSKVLMDLHQRYVSTICKLQRELEIRGSRSQKESFQREVFGQITQQLEHVKTALSQTNTGTLRYFQVDLEALSSD